MDPLHPLRRFFLHVFVMSTHSCEGCSINKRLWLQLGQSRWVYSFGNFQFSSRGIESVLSSWKAEWRLNGNLFPALVVIKPGIFWREYQMPEQPMPLRHKRTNLRSMRASQQTETMPILSTVEQLVLRIIDKYFLKAQRKLSHRTESHR